MPTVATWPLSAIANAVVSNGDEDVNTTFELSPAPGAASPMSQITTLPPAFQASLRPSGLKRRAEPSFPYALLGSVTTPVCIPSACVSAPVRASMSAPPTRDDPPTVATTPTSADPGRNAGTDTMLLPIPRLSLGRTCSGWPPRVEYVINAQWCAPVLDDG